jgi:hypothetical protein
MRQNANNVCDEIVRNLYIGNRRAVDDGPHVFHMIVNCTPDIPLPTYCNQTIRIPIQDDPDEVNAMLQYMQETGVLEKIYTAVNQGERILVHCSAGMQRSCALVACYLVWYRGLSAEEAVEYIRQKRPVAFFGGANLWNAIYQTELRRNRIRNRV